MNKQYEIRYDTKLWTYDTNCITDLPTDEQGMERFKNDIKSIVENQLNHTTGIQSYKFSEPINDNTDLGLPILFVLSVESDKDVTDQLEQRIDNYITDVSAYDYCNDLSQYDSDEENESGWNLNEVTIELYISEV